MRVALAHVYVADCSITLVVAQRVQRRTRDQQAVVQILPGAKAA